MTLEAEELVRTVLGDQRTACITCSFQAEDMVVLDLARAVRPSIPVLFLDTGFHFPETLAYRDRMADAWQLNVINIRPELSRSEQEVRFPVLYQTDPARCCRIRKVEPLFSALPTYDVWLTGLRREQSPTRANLQAVEYQELRVGKVIQKVSPLAAWTSKEVWSYLRVNEIDYLPLYDQGYTSIGCQPCTAIPTDPANPRSGRWGGVKLECGIHTSGRNE